MGRFSPEDDTRAVAIRTAEIQTQAWRGWLEAKGVNQDVIESTLWSDVTNESHIAARETRLREAFGRTDQNEAVLYFGAFAANGEMVGFSKFMLFEEENRLVMLLAEIDVMPDYQGKKAEDPADHDLAKKMIYSAVANIQRDTTLLILEVLEGNARARALYERLGFTYGDSSGNFPFEDADERLVHVEPHLQMEANAVTVRNNLRAELGLQ